MTIEDQPGTVMSTLAAPDGPSAATTLAAPMATDVETMVISHEQATLPGGPQMDAIVVENMRRQVETLAPGDATKWGTFSQRHRMAPPFRQGRCETFERYNVRLQIVCHDEYYPHGPPGTCNSNTRFERYMGMLTGTYPISQPIAMAAMWFLYFALFTDRHVKPGLFHLPPGDGNLQERSSEHNDSLQDFPAKSSMTYAKSK